MHSPTKMTGSEWQLPPSSLLLQPLAKVLDAALRSPACLLTLHSFFTPFFIHALYFEIEQQKWGHQKKEPPTQLLKKEGSIF